MVLIIELLCKGMAKLGQGIVMQGMAEGIANSSTLPTGWQNWGRV